MPPKTPMPATILCGELWRPYLKVIVKKAGQAIHVLDRFHIMGHWGQGRR